MQRETAGSEVRFGLCRGVSAKFVLTLWPGVVKRESWFGESVMC